MAFVQVRDSNLYQNGRVIENLDSSDEELLLRNELSVEAQITDAYRYYREGDNLKGIAYYHYKDLVSNANEYWWLIADRNDVFDPIEETFIQGDGDLVSMIGQTIVVPNVLTQQPQL